MKKQIKLKMMEHNNNSIAGKIKKAMLSSSAICLGILGVVSLVFITANTNTLLETNMTETVEVASSLVEEEISTMKKLTYEIGCNPALAGTVYTDEEKIEILQKKVEQYEFTGCGLTMQDNIDIVSGWDCTTQDSVVRALAGETYFSEPKIKNGGPLCSYFSAPLWKDGIANSEIVGTVIFMSNDYFLQDMVKNISISENCNVFILDQHGNTIADASQATLTEIINMETLAETDGSYKGIAEISARMKSGENGFDTYIQDGKGYYIAYAPIEETEGWSLAITVRQRDYLGTYFLSIAAVIIIMAIALCVSAVKAKKIAVNISNPINACVNRMKLLATGDLHSEVLIDESLQEAQALTEATAELTTGLNTLIGDMAYILAELAKGDFSVQSKQEESYVGDFASLVISVNELTEKLSETLRHIQEAANQVMHGSSQMSVSAQDLAEGATHQTEAVNTLRNTIINITDFVEKNAEQSRMALDKMEDVKQATIDSNEEMMSMTVAMQRISDTSMEISNIVTEIEDIASQTNLLSLNASIEAARAGEAGRGFAVVAEEIRKLAENSSRSATHTKELIDASVAEVEKGNQITTRTAEALKRVIDGLSIVREGAMASTKLSAEQAVAMREIEEDIKLITDVVQNNSATAEETSAICAELSSQATGLNGLVEEFKI